MQQAKMTIMDYEKQYSNKIGSQSMKSLTTILTGVTGAILLTMFALLTLKIFDINQYAGYAAIAVFAVIFVLIYVVPIIKIKSMKSFDVNIKHKSLKAANKYNRALRNELADKMIEFSNDVDEATWYPPDKIALLQTARLAKNDDAVKDILSDMYGKEISDKCRNIILKSALRSGITTAVSQSPQIDTIIVLTVNLQLIKDIVYLYGFRPSDAQMLKIYKTIIASSITAYGINNIDVGSVVKSITKEAFGLVPILGATISTLTNSAFQGIANLSLTAVIGFQTKKYLIKEYKLQELLENLEVDNDAAVKELIVEAENELKRIVKTKKAPATDEK